MSCCESEKYKRAKDYNRMVILGTQIASITGVNQVITERIHGRYGNYYEIIQEGKQNPGETILQVIRPLPAPSVQSSSKSRKSKSVGYTRQSD